MLPLLIVENIPFDKTIGVLCRVRGGYFELNPDQSFLPLTASAAKAGSRTGKAFYSYKKGGIRNLVFWGNSLSSGFAWLSFTSNIFSKILPPPSRLVFYSLSIACGAFSDIIDNSCHSRHPQVGKARFSKDSSSNKTQ